MSGKLCCVVCESYTMSGFVYVKYTARDEVESMYISRIQIHEWYNSLIPQIEWLSPYPDNVEGKLLMSVSFCLPTMQIMHT